jgi:hypothetical protein
MVGLISRGRGEGVATVNLTAADLYRVVALPCGRTTFSLGVDLIVFFRDDDGDGILDGKDIPIAPLDVFREEGDGTWTLQNVNRTVDTVNRFIRVTVTQTGTFGLFSFPKPATVADLRVARSGADLSLTWNPVTQYEKGNALSVDHYNVYAGTSPAFYPDLIAQTNRVGYSASAVYTHTVVNGDGTDRYYLVTAVDGLGRGSYPR